MYNKSLLNDLFSEQNEKEIEKITQTFIKKNAGNVNL